MSKGNGGNGTAYHPKRAPDGAIVDMEGFNLWYGESQALFDVSMDFQRGLVTALIGPSGCGKSTLIRSINRMNDLIDDLSVGGTMRIDGEDIYASGIDVIGLRKRMGMVFQKPNPFPKTVFENVVYPLRVDGVTDRTVLEKACEQALKGAALWEEVHDRLQESALGLSGGQQQRLCIARAIASDPEVLLMDEPCSALDPIATERIEELIVELKRHYTIIIVTHNMQQASRVSEFTGFFYLGRLVEFGETAQIFTRPGDERTEAYITGRFG